MEFPYRYISIEGCIGAGKTSLSTHLAVDFDALLILEQFEDNAFLPKFYANQERYAFPLELSFLADRFRQFKEKLINPDLFHHLIISDYIFPKSLIFARKTLADDEYQLYVRLFSIIDSNLPRPDLIVYLYSSPDQLMANIRKRGREYEQNISAEYLEKIQNSYLDYFKELSKQRILLLNTAGLDFVARPDDYCKVKDLIMQEYPVGISVR